MTRARPQQGFMLVLTIWILAAITIAASYFAERGQKSLQLAQRRQANTAAQISLSDSRAEILFRLATTPFTQLGLGVAPDVIALDDRPYSTDDSVVRLQDTRGLLNLNAFVDDQMQRLLVNLGVPSALCPTLIDALRDYADTDDMQRLNGAESQQYREQGLPSPRNLPLVSPIELRNVIGWRNLPQAQVGAGLFDLVSADPSSKPILNPNTAPWQVLMAVTGASQELTKAIVERRQLEPVTAAMLDRMLGTHFDGIPALATGFPADTVRVTHEVPELPWTLRYNVKMTPKGADSPWQITYFYRLERKVNAGPAPDATDPPVLPPKQVLPATPSLFPSS